MAAREALSRDRVETADAPEYVGPGGQDVVVGPDGEDHLVFHSWYGQTTYWGMNVFPLTWRDGAPVVTPG